jgi:hypothetical protein
MTAFTPKPVDPSSEKPFAHKGFFPYFFTGK